MKQISNKQKKKLICLLLIVCFLTTGVLVYLFGNKPSTNEIESTDTTNSVEGGCPEEIVEEEIENYISDYLKKANVKENISDEDMEEIIAQVSAGVLNSLPENSLSTEEQVEVRALVADAVNQSIKENNENTDNTSFTNVMDDELKKYIDNTIVPRLTALIQINSGEIDNLKSSLEMYSTTYNQDKKTYDTSIDNISTSLKNLSTQTSSDKEKLKSDINQLNSALEGYKSNTSTSLTALNNELYLAKRAINTLRLAETQDQADIATLDVRLNMIEANLSYLTEEMESKLTILKENLQTQIAENEKLSEQQKTELLTQINNVSVDNVQNVNDVKQQLSSYIVSYQEDAAAISTAIGELDEDSGSLYEQILANKNLSDSQKNLLTDMINDLGITTETNLQDAKSELLEKNNELREALTTEVANLNGTIDTVKLDLGDLSETVDTMQIDIDSLSGTLSKVQEDVYSLSGTVSKVQSDVHDLSGTLSTVQTNVEDLSGTLSTVQSNVENLSGTLSTVQSDVATLSGTLSTVQSNVYNLSETIKTVQTDYKQADQNILQQLNNKLATKADANHNHNNLYYTKTEMDQSINNILNTKCNNLYTRPVVFSAFTLQANESRNFNFKDYLNTNYPDIDFFAVVGWNVGNYGDISILTADVFTGDFVVINNSDYAITFPDGMYIIVLGQSK